jgi:hypothetical protein
MPPDGLSTTVMASYSRQRPQTILDWIKFAVQSHAPFALVHRVLRVLSAMLQVGVLPGFDARQPLTVSGPIALRLIGDGHASDVTAAFEELAEKFLRGLLLPRTLDRDIPYLAVLIHRPPEGMAFAMNGRKYLINGLVTHDTCGRSRQSPTTRRWSRPP